MSWIDSVDALRTTGLGLLSQFTSEFRFDLPDPDTLSHASFQLGD